MYSSSVADNEIQNRTIIIICPHNQIRKPHPSSILRLPCGPWINHQHYSTFTLWKSFPIIIDHIIIIFFLLFFHWEMRYFERNFLILHTGICLPGPSLDCSVPCLLSNVIRIYFIIREIRWASRHANVEKGILLPIAFRCRSQQKTNRMDGCRKIKSIEIYII